MYIYWMCCSLHGISDDTLCMLTILPSISVARPLNLPNALFVLESAVIFRHTDPAPRLCASVWPCEGASTDEGQTEERRTRWS